MKNYYQCLNLDQNATFDEIKAAYKIYAKKFHPDIHQNDTFFKERFQEIQEAYEILSNYDKRKEYDKLFFNRNNINPPEVILTANKLKFTVGERVFFNWATKNVDYILIKGFGTFNPTDTFSAILNKTTIFNFSFQGQGGTQNIDKTIYVSNEEDNIKATSNQTVHNKGIQAIIRKYTAFSGRTRRKEFLYFRLFHLIFFIIAMIIDNVLGITISESPYGAISIVYLLLFLFPIYAIDVRRLHDVDKSGWMLLLLFLPYIGLIWILLLFFREGTYGGNKYGSDPKKL